MENVLMKCGHISNAESEGKPCCVICNCFDIDKEKIDNLDKRLAKCTECGDITKSKDSLPFFKYNPDKEYDSYYCGCWGWN